MWVLEKLKSVVKKELGNQEGCVSNQSHLEVKVQENDREIRRDQSTMKMHVINVWKKNVFTSVPSNVSGGFF